MKQQDTTAPHGHGVIVLCDQCEEPFNTTDRAPTILPDCGHTLCVQCLMDMDADANIVDKYCWLCKTPIKYKFEQYDKFLPNHKILSMISKPGAVKLSNFIPCDLHEDKPVEYFCKACALAVCVKCIYDSHNGHNLVQVDDMCKHPSYSPTVATNLRNNITSLSKVILNSRKMTDESTNLLDLARQELRKLMNQQMRNLDNGFNSLIKRIEEKKLELIVEYEK